MTIMAETEADLRRGRPLFVLEKLSRRLRSDVLADGSIVSLCELTMKRPAHLTDEIVVIRDDLFAAFRTASDSPAVHQLRDRNDALVDTTISINEDGSGTVDIAATKVRFPWVTLLSSDVEMRLSQLAAVLSRYPLRQRDADSLRALVARWNILMTISWPSSQCWNHHRKPLQKGSMRGFGAKLKTIASARMTSCPGTCVIGIT
jgi:hypothetical protein